MELISIASDLMPEGKPTYLEVIRYPKIRDLVQQTGKPTMLKALFLLVKDFCGSLNVVRNMNENQMIECAAMLFDECGNFRLEDYVMMFKMAKQGQLVKIRDRIDMEVVSEIMDEYWLRRKRAGDEYLEQGVKHIDSMGSTMTTLDQMNPQDAKLVQSANGLLGAIDSMRKNYTEWKDSGDAKDKLKKGHHDTNPD
jgi:hypothetical protein